jgi:glycosyltransferase involved in cell wall biosynthesis
MANGFHDKMEVIMVSTSARTRGGVASVVNEYFSAGLAEQVNIVKIDTHVDGSVFRKMAALGNGFLLFLMNLLVRRRIRVVHIMFSSRWSFWRKSLFLVVGKVLFRKKIIMHLHGAEFKQFYYQESGIWKRQLIRYLLRSADVLLVLAQTWKSDIEKFLRGANIRVLYNPVNCSQRSPRESFGNQLLFLGKYGKRKGIYDLLRVVSEMGDAVVLEARGDGELERVRRIISRNAINNVTVGGWITGAEKERLLKSSDIFVLPSYDEGLPMGVLEAQAYGIPVISTDVGGTAEIITDGKNGFLIAPGDTDALKERIQTLISDKSLMRQMSRRSLEVVECKFDSRVIVRQLVAIYAELAGCQYHAVS